MLTIRIVYVGINEGVCVLVISVLKKNKVIFKCEWPTDYLTYIKKARDWRAWRWWGLNERNCGVWRKCHVRTLLLEARVVLRHFFPLWTKNQECDEGPNQAKADKSSHHSPNNGRCTISRCISILGRSVIVTTTATTVTCGWNWRVRRLWRGRRGRRAWGFDAPHSIGKSYIERVWNLWKFLAINFRFPYRSANTETSWYA